MVGPKGADQRGFALLIVLWSIVLLAFIATGITASGRTEAQLASNIRDAAVAEAAADGAVQEAAFHLLSPANPWPADGRTRNLSVPGATISLLMQDEGGKVNPNLASRELLEALLRQAGLVTDAAGALASNIAAWRFPRAEGGFGVAGLGAAGAAAAEAPVVQQYRAAGRDYGPPGAPFETIDELSLVLGMTPALLDRLRPSLSLLAEAEPEPALADALVRRALATARPQGAGPARAPGRPKAATILAEAVTPTGARFTRRAVVRLSRTGDDPPLTIATWDTGLGSP